MGINDKFRPSKPTLSALAWVFVSITTIVMAGMICFYFMWTKAERERDAEYRHGWNYAGANQALRKYPNEPSAHIAMASVWMKQKQYGKAVAQYKQAVILEPKNPYNHLDLGNALDQLGQTTGARREWRTVADLDVSGGQAKMVALRRLASNKSLITSPALPR